MADADKVSEPLTAKRDTTKELGQQPEPVGDDEKDDKKGGDEKVQTDDQSGGGDEIKKGSHEIVFKWRGVKEKKDCDTKHMLYLLHLALEKTRIRQIERNKNFASLGRKDRIMKHPDYPRVITNFIDWHNKDPENNKFDGNLITTRGKKDVTNNVLSTIGDVKWGWATKFYHYLMKEVTIDAENWHEVKIPNYGHTKLKSDGKILEECTVEDIVTVLEKFAYPKFTDPSQKKWALDIYQGKITEYIKNQSIDGAKFKQIGKKQFVEDLKNSLDPSNKKLKGPCTKLYVAIEKCNLNEVFNQ